jgi:hypothetical protein
MAFGNGGTTINDVGDISYNCEEELGYLIYNSPNIDGNTASSGLYNETHIESNPEIALEQHIGENYSDIIITSVLDYSSIADQSVTDNASCDEDTDYIFDELALKSESGAYLTHIVFHPVQKSANRKIKVIYTLRIIAGI